LEACAGIEATPVIRIALTNPSMNLFIGSLLVLAIRTQIDGQRAALPGDTDTSTSALYRFQDRLDSESENGLRSDPNRTPIPGMEEIRRDQHYLLFPGEG
jgi:hypothetical protein